MREIKFRAWDKESQEMKTITELDFLFLGKQNNHHAYQGKISDIWLNDENVSYAPVDVELMQYTGLKDKNGKEIYEGDIVEKTYYSYHQPECSELFEIKYEGLGFYFEHIKGNAFYLPFTEDIEIIGNIYENPKLLSI